MAGVTYGPFMKTAPGGPPKRVFDNITNKGTTTEPPKKPKPEPEPPQKKYVGGWSKTDLSSSEPHSDATKEGDMARRTYRFTITVQASHASNSLASDAAFYDHDKPDAIGALKARRSGQGVTSKQILKQMPTGGGVSRVKLAPEISPDVVGRHELKAAASALGNEVKARKEQILGKGKKHEKGTTFARPFQVWRADKESQEDSPWYTRINTAVADCKQRWPVKQGDPAYATTKMTTALLQILQGTSYQKFRVTERKGLKRDRDNTKWELAWKEQ